MIRCGVFIWMSGRWWTRTRRSRKASGGDDGWQGEVPELGSVMSVAAACAISGRLSRTSNPRVARGVGECSIAGAVSLSMGGEA